MNIFLKKLDKRKLRVYELILIYERSSSHVTYLFSYRLNVYGAIYLNKTCIKHVDKLSNNSY